MSMTTTKTTHSDGEEVVRAPVSRPTADSLDSDIEESEQKYPEPEASNNPLWVDSLATDLGGLMPRKIAELAIEPLIICLRSGAQPDLDICSSRVLTAEQQRRGAATYTIFRMHRDMMQQLYTRTMGHYIESRHLEAWNARGVELSSESPEYVVAMPLVTEDLAGKLQQLYPTHSHDTERSIANIGSALAVLGEKPWSGAVKNLRSMDYLRDGGDYWTHQYNCFMTMTGWFKNRAFEYDKRKRQNLINTALLEEESVPVDNEDRKEEEETGEQAPARAEMITIPNVKLMDSSPSFSENVARRTVEADASHAVKFAGQSLYEPFPGTPIDADFERQWSAAVTERDRFDLVVRLIINPRTAHVLNSVKFLDATKELREKYMPIIKYAWSYAWLCLYIEECVDRKESRDDSRYVFGIDAASRLQIFPHVPFDIHISPYVTAMVDKRAAHMNRPGKMSPLGLAIPQDWSGAGVASRKELQRNLNIYTTSDASRNILEGIVWNDVKSGLVGHLSGSTISACSTRIHPMVLRFKTKSNSWNDAINAYMLKYYTQGTMRADLDLGCYSKSVFQFLDWAYASAESVIRNSLRWKIIKHRKQVQMRSVKSLYMYITRRYLETNFPNDDVNTLIATLGTCNRLRQHFYSIYVRMKEENNCAERALHKSKYDGYEQYWRFVPEEDMNLVFVESMITERPESTYGDLEYYIRKNKNINEDVHQFIMKNASSCPELEFYMRADGIGMCPYNLKREELENNAEENPILLKFAENVKIQALCEAWNHDLELYRIRTQNVAAHVGRFHLPVVRGWIWFERDSETGREVVNAKYHPSCISAMMTMLCIDYRCFAGTKDQRCIMIKNLIRGWGIIFTLEERTELLPAWRSSKRVHALAKVDAGKSVKSALFGMRTPANTTVEKAGSGKFAESLSYIMSTRELRKWLRAKHHLSDVLMGVNPLGLKAIGSDGFVQPLNLELIFYCYDLLERTYREPEQNHEVVIVPVKRAKKKECDGTDGVEDPDSDEIDDESGIDDDASDPSSSEEETEKKKKSRKSDDDDTEDDSSNKKSKRSHKKKAESEDDKPKPKKTISKKRHISDGSESDDDKPRKGKVTKNKKRPISDISESDDDKPRKGKVTKNKKRPISDGSESDDDKPRKGKVTKNKKRPISDGSESEEKPRKSSKKYLSTDTESEEKSRKSKAKSKTLEKIKKHRAVSPSSSSRHSESDDESSDNEKKMAKPSQRKVVKSSVEKKPSKGSEKSVVSSNSSSRRESVALPTPPAIHNDHDSDNSDIDMRRKVVDYIVEEMEIHKLNTDEEAEMAEDLNEVFVNHASRCECHDCGGIESEAIHASFCRCDACQSNTSKRAPEMAFGAASESDSEDGVEREAAPASDDDVSERIAAVSEVEDDDPSDVPVDDDTRVTVHHHSLSVQYDDGINPSSNSTAIGTVKASTDDTRDQLLSNMQERLALLTSMLGAPHDPPETAPAQIAKREYAPLRVSELERDILLASGTGAYYSARETLAPSVIEASIPIQEQTVPDLIIDDSDSDDDEDDAATVEDERSSDIAIYETASQDVVACAPDEINNGIIPAVNDQPSIDTSVQPSTESQSESHTAAPTPVQSDETAQPPQVMEIAHVNIVPVQPQTKQNWEDVLSILRSGGGWKNATTGKSTI